MRGKFFTWESRYDRKRKKTFCWKRLIIVRQHKIDYIKLAMIDSILMHDFLISLPRVHLHFSRLWRFIRKWDRCISIKIVREPFYIIFFYIKNHTYCVLYMKYYFCTYTLFVTYLYVASLWILKTNLNSNWFVKLYSELNLIYAMQMRTLWRTLRRDRKVHRLHPLSTLFIRKTFL